MSTRLSGSTKDIINKAYNFKISSLKQKLNKLEETEQIKIKTSIRNYKEFDDLLVASKKLKERVEREYPDFYWYSDFRSLFKFDEYDNKDFGYLEKDSTKEILQNNNEYLSIQEELKSLEKEKINLLFKLENAPIKSKDYEEAYYKLKEILNQE